MGRDEEHCKLGDVTPDALDAWAASWTGASNTQGFRLSRVKAFFRWAHGLRKMEENLAAVLRLIRRENAEETQPLTAAQFEEVLAAAYTYDEDRRSVCGQATWHEDGCEWATVNLCRRRYGPPACYVIVFATLPARCVTARQVLACYRLR